MTDSELRGRPFFCREWALQRLQHCLEGVCGAPGILITGGPGAGKTALCAELVWPSSEAGQNSWLSSRVVAHHFCQAHTHLSLDPKYFIQNLAQQLHQSPLIPGYRAPEEADTGDLRDMFQRLVLSPLAALAPPSHNLLLLVDSVDETCCCCRVDGLGAESSCSIAELLANQHELLPPWLLLVCSARRQNKAVTRMFSGFRRLCLDDLRKAHAVRDVQQYILHRLEAESRLQHHLTPEAAEMLNQLHIKSNGCFLYLERVLDGVGAGSIAIREIRNIPGTLNGLYLWLCQRMFPGGHFCRAQILLNILLAAPTPLTPGELHRAAWTKETRGWSHEDFARCLDSLAPFIRVTGAPPHTLLIFHHSFSEWLLDVKYCTQRFLCSVAEGHGMLAMSLSLRAPDLTPAEVHQLARHLLLCGLRGVEACHLALWLLCTGAPVAHCLASDVPLELDVLQLLLLASPGLPATAAGPGLPAALRRTLERSHPADPGGSLNKRDRAGRTLLAAAAHAGDPEAVALMISRGADLEAADDYGQTGLGLAAHRGHLSVVRLLLDHGARTDHADTQGWTPLRAAAWGGHTEVVEALLAAGARPDVSGPDGRTALRAAAWGGHEGPARALLRAGAAVDHSDAEGWTPLMTAAYMGHRAMAALLLDSGAGVNHRDSEGRTALAVACLRVPAGPAYPEVVSLLLERGADPELADKEGVAPLLVAAYEGKEEVAELLLEAGADPDRPDGGHMTPLLAAASGGHAETVRVLLLWGAATDVTDAEGRSALSLAAAAARGDEAVRVLLDRGLNENDQDLLGWTALHWAACQGRRGACRALMEGGARAGTRDHEGCTPLHLAAQEGHVTCVEFLINRGAHVDLEAADHMTPLCFAALAGHAPTVQLLLKKGADPDVRTAHGKPLLYLLALQGLRGMAEILLEHGADPEGRDLEERTALHASCWQGDLDMARTLLVRGKANCNAFDKERRTPLHCAAWRGHHNIAQLLLDNGAYADAQCSQGATPLCIAAQEGHQELARVLLEEGKASPFHADRYGRTPMGVAAKGGHSAIVHLLERHGVPPYRGIMGKPAEPRDAAAAAVGSWSTLSPISSGSQSLDSSLKSSKGSILTSSTVPADSLTFTQQLQQHSLPRSRSRQAAALAGHAPSSTQHPSGWPARDLPHELQRLEVAEPGRNGIVTSPTHSRYKAAGPAHLHKTSSSGYSSSPGGDQHDRKTTDPPSKLQSPNQPAPGSRGNPSPMKSLSPVTSPKEHSPGSGGNPSPKEHVPVSRGNPSPKEHVPVSRGNPSPMKRPDPVTSTKEHSSGSRGNPSPMKSPAPLTSSKEHVPGSRGNPSPKEHVPGSRGNPSPMMSPAPLTSTKEHAVGSRGNPFHAGSPIKSPAPLTSPKNSPTPSTKGSGPPPYPSDSHQDFIYSPGRIADIAASPRSPAKKAQQPPSSHGSPVISITTMDPQLHLKQAIKLQFEGRTCGFNYRRETPL